MKLQLITCVRVSRDRFAIPDFVGEENILALLRSGSFWFRTERGRYTVRAGEAALFRRWTPCHREVVEHCEMYLFKYSSDVPVFEDEHIIFEDASRIASTLRLLDRAGGLMKDGFLYQRRLFEDIVTQYLIERGVAVGSSDDPLLEEAVTFINEHMQYKISLAEVARRSGLSYVQFVRRFTAYAGMTPSEYLAAIRMKKAESLLSDTALPVKEVAAACGFENEYYFSSFFKKHKGISPCAFRKAAT